MGLNREVRQGRYGEVFVRALAEAAGFTVQKMNDDYILVDLLVGYPGAKGTLRNPLIGVQVKASRRARRGRAGWTYNLESKYYNELAEPPGQLSMPTFLVLVVVPENTDRWVDTSEDHVLLRQAAYWTCLHGERQRRDLKPDSKVPVSFPYENLLSKDAFQRMLDVARRLREDGQGVYS